MITTFINIFKHEEACNSIPGQPFSPPVPRPRSMITDNVTGLISRAASRPFWNERKNNAHLHGDVAVGWADDGRQWRMVERGGRGLARGVLICQRARDEGKALLQCPVLRLAVVTQIHSERYSRQEGAVIVHLGSDGNITNCHAKHAVRSRNESLAATVNSPLRTVSASQNTNNE